MPGVYVAAQRWDISLLESLCGFATGVILGDLFCQKRMFEHDWFDILDFAQQARRFDFDVVFQTPVYNTPRTMELTLALIRKLYHVHCLDSVLVHDIGMLEAVKQYEGVALWWDKFAFNRDMIVSAALLDFLQSQNVSHIEMMRPADIEKTAPHACNGLLHAYGPRIVSFGRVCYTEYFLNEPCERKILCHQHQPFITSVDKIPLQYSADGYTLLDKNVPVYTVPSLTQAQARGVSEITTYIRNQDEIAQLYTVAQNIAIAQADSRATTCF
jgi:hypothetical protein